MDGGAPHQNEKTRIAYLITIVLLFSIGLIVVENAGRQKTISDSATANEWYLQLGDMLGRLKSFRERNALFFSQVLFENVTNEWGCVPTPGPCKSIAFRVARHTTVGGGFSFDSIEGDTDLYQKIENQTKKAGEAIAEIFKRADSVTLEDLHAVVSADLSPEYAAIISSDELMELVTLKNTGSWPQMIQWIVYGDLHIPLSSGPTLHFVGYQQEGGVPYDEIRRHIFEVLTVKSNLPEMETVLVHEWDAMFSVYVDKRKGPASFSVFGSEMKLQSLQYVVALSLAFTGLLFLFALTVRLETIIPRTPNDPPLKLTFPDYGRFQTSVQPPDPATSLMCTTLWWSFVCAPILLLSLGVLYRYVMPIGNSTSFSPLAIAMIVKIPDDFSFACDVINLVCLSTCFISFFMVENLGEQPRLKGKYFVLSTVTAAASVFSLVWTYHVISHWYGEEYSIKAYHIQLALIFIWIGVTFCAAWRGHRGLWNISIVFLTLYAALGIGLLRGV